VTLDQLCARLDIDGIVGQDFETYWAKDYTLSKLPTTEYIMDPRFKSHMCSVQWHDEKRAAVLDPKGLKAWAKKVDWKRTGLLGHHTQFDGLILSKHFGITPAFYFDTLSMLRPLKPVMVGGSLDAACKAFGLRGKRGQKSLLNTQGVRDLSPEQYDKLAAYAGNDSEQTWLLFKKLLPYLPFDELFIIDATIRMYCQPRLLIDGKMVQKLHDTEVAEKVAIVKQLKTTPETLRSKNKFAQLLIKAGVEPPMKQGKKSEIWALAKTDLAFKALLGHPVKRVRDLVRGRLRLSSSILEKRAQRLSLRAEYGAQPIYLNYAKAITWRWSGGDKMNWQNPNKGTALREAIHAPKGSKLIIADSAQIEARINACFAGQNDVVELFRRGEDVYAHAATKIYGRPIDKKRDPRERQLGKVATLMLGYQAGPAKYAHSVRTDKQMPMDITDAQARDTVYAWRQANSKIAASWLATNNLVKQAFINKTRVEHGCVAYEGVGRHGYMHLPNGCSIRYAELEIDDDGSLSYLRSVKPKKKGDPTQVRKRLYGGLLTENRTQALARVLLCQNIVEIRRRAPWMQLVMTTHDELVYIVSDAKAKQGLKIVEEIMREPPAWMPDLPLAVDAEISQFYSK
jgi:DNA polymerase